MECSQGSGGADVFGGGIPLDLEEMEEDNSYEEAKGKPGAEGEGDYQWEMSLSLRAKENLHIPPQFTRDRSSAYSADTPPIGSLVTHNSKKRTGRSIVCVMPPLPAAESAVPICVQFEKKHCIRKNLTFWYRENPLIESISPNTSYVSGGRRITVTGQRFYLAQTIHMVIEDSGKAQS
eukprot:g43842.t1